MGNRIVANYVEADFNAGGMENADNISAVNAFLREVIEERYVSGFGMHMLYNDARRLRKSDNDIAVPYVMYNSDNESQNVCRMQQMS